LYSFSSTSHFRYIVISIYRLRFKVRNNPKALLAMEISFTVLRLWSDATNDERKKVLTIKSLYCTSKLLALGAINFVYL